MPTSSEHVWRRFGAELRKFREHAGMTQGQLARAVPMSQSQVSALECGTRGTTPAQIRRFDQVLTTGGALFRRWEEARNQHGYASWFIGTAELEKEASEIREYHPLLVPGLLQTKDYARTIISVGRPTDTDSEITERVEARLERQRLLSEERPPLILVVLDEAVLRRPIGGPEVMAAQLERLLELTSSPRVTLQVIPMATERHPGLDGAFRVITVPDKGQMVYIETRITGSPIDDPEVIRQFTSLYGDLRGVALPPVASQEVIKRAWGDLR